MSHKEVSEKSSACKPISVVWNIRGTWRAAIVTTYFVPITDLHEENQKKMKKIVAQQYCTCDRHASS